MHLFAAIVPPGNVLEAVAEVVRKADVAPMGEPAGALLPDLLQLPIASFGNVAVGDAERLGRALPEVTGALPPPTLYLAGSAALEFPGDQGVWAKVDGDLEDLRLIPPAVTRGVEPLGIFVDRRQFRPMLSLATITDATTVEVLQQAVDAPDEFRGEPWRVDHVSLRKRLLDRVPPSSEEMERLPLGVGT